jgi:predicted amino acid-binding ACT domain protein
MSADGKGRESLGRYSPTKTLTPSTPIASDPLIIEMCSDIRNQGCVIDEIKDVLNDVDVNIQKINNSITKMQVQLDNLVTKANCAKNMASLSNNLKDRINGKRKVTGVDITVPRNSIRKNRSILYWVTLAAAVITLSGAVWGVFTFVIEINKRQERTEQILININKNLSKSN